ncbi:hypothetical protein C8J56DRAFT_1041955 [Mycena floridula]|nr:hypothetical protein C8J56DRAFT_1041955 [Mycena floridula]
MLFFHFLFLAGLNRFVAADTEIVNFDTSTVGNFRFVPPLDWQILSPEAPEIRLSLAPAHLNTPINEVCWSTQGSDACPNELWVVLDVDQSNWTSYKKFTLRLSWAASFPTHFSLEVLNAEDVAALFSESQTSSTSFSRTKYARIRAVNTGVRPASTNDVENKPVPVPFILTLEPLYFGFLPSSVLPIIIFLLPIIVISALSVNYVQRHVQILAIKARKDIFAKSL